MPYMQMTEEQFKVPVLKNVIYALRLVWQTDKRLLIGYLLQEGLYAVFSRYLQNILFLKILLDVITGSGDFRTYVGELAAFALLALVVKVAQWEGMRMEKCATKRVRRALEHSGFQRPLPRGVDTQLLREFDDDGLMLSGGESQKVAVARAFYKDCPFVILDEPSANLDPVAEYQLNRAMLEAARDKTVIFISHRLSTTVQADKIYVMEQGRIIESGSHSELMAADGTYAYMFRLQAEKYKNAKSE